MIMQKTLKVYGGARRFRGGAESRFGSMAGTLLEAASEPHSTEPAGNNGPQAHLDAPRIQREIAVPGTPKGVEFAGVCR